MSEHAAEIGARVRLWIGPPVRGGWQYGEVIGIDDGTRPGLRIRFDEPVNGQPTCYATHGEVERVIRVIPSAVGQAEHDSNGRLDRSICGLCGDAYAECSKCGVYLCDCTRTGTCAKGESDGVA